MKAIPFKKLTSLVLAFLMVVSLIPAIAITTSAAENTVTLNFAGGSGTNLDPISFTDDASGVSAKFTAGTHSTKPRWDASCVRFYGTASATNNLTVSVPEGCTVTKIEFTMNGTYKTTAVSADSGTIDTATNTWTGSATSVVFTTAAQTRFESVNITYTAPEACTHENETAIGEAKDATCTEDGITAGVKCADCGEELTAQETIPATGHTDENPVDSKCDTCGTNLCTEHVWVDGDVVTEGNCTTDRVVAQVCQNCGEPGENKVTTAPGHTEVTDEAVDATCTATGLTEGKHCSVCEEVLEAQTVVDALGHTYVNGACSVCGEAKPVIPEYVLTDLADITANMTVIIVASKDTTNWAMSNDKGSSGAPSAVVVTVDGSTISTNATNILWNIANDNDALTIYPAGQTENYLYCTNTNNGVRVGTTTSGVGTFTMGNNGYLTVATSTTRYLGVYNSQDWRCYSNTTGNTAGQTFAFYVLSTDLPCEHIWINDGESTPATCTEDGAQPQKCEKCGETQSVTLPATGHNFVDGVCTNEGCDEIACDHVDKGITLGEITKEASCTETGLQEQFCAQCGQPLEDKVLDKIAHTPETDAAVDATCTATGLTEGSHCSVCKEVLVEQTEVPMVDHDYVDNKCTVCGDIVVTGTQLADFQFGENGDASHKDGAVGDLEATYTTNGYTLTPANTTNVYGSAFDAKGNSALKLGTSSNAASFGFTVPSNCNTVVLYIAGYKANTAKIDINKTEYEITSKSNDGAYTKIVVDTTSNKTVTLTTLPGGYRAMIDSIEFWGEEYIVTENTVGGYTVTLGDNIGVNFFMELTKDTLADDTAYMLFTLPNGDTEKKDIVPTEQGGKTLYKFTAEIAAKEMADEIKAQLFTTAGNSVEYTYTVKEYAEYILTSEDYSNNAKALVKAMLNYGANAQLMFGYNTGVLANSVLTDEEKKIADVTIDESYKMSYTDDIDGVTFLGTTTMWEADTSIRLYFEITGENVTFTLNGTELTVHEGKYGKYVAIEGIISKDMEKTHTLVVSNGTQEQTIKYSVYSYFYDFLASDSYTLEQKTAIKAAYLYSQAAIVYNQNPNA